MSYIKSIHVFSCVPWWNSSCCSGFCWRKKNWNQAKPSLHLCKHSRDQIYHSLDVVEIKSIIHSSAQLFQVFSMKTLLELTTGSYFFTSRGSAEWDGLWPRQQQRAWPEQRYVKAAKVRDRNWSQFHLQITTANASRQANVILSGENISKNKESEINK